MKAAIDDEQMRISDIYEKLYEEMGDLGWWPGDDPDEVLIGSILTQNTSWNNVEKALDVLRKNDCLSLECISSKKHRALSEMIRSSGFHNQKAQRLIDISRKILERYGSLKAMSSDSEKDLAEFLFSMKGVGEETRDSILLYALGKPVFVVDKYTERIFLRTGTISADSELKTVRETVPQLMELDTGKLKNFHGMLVKLAKEHCRTRPECSGCPLSGSCKYYKEEMLP